MCTIALPLLILREASCHTVSCHTDRSMWQGGNNLMNSQPWFASSHANEVGSRCSTSLCNQCCQHHQLQLIVSKPNKLGKYMVLSSTFRLFTNKLTKHKPNSQRKRENEENRFVYLLVSTFLIRTFLSLAE